MKIKNFELEKKYPVHYSIQNVYHIFKIFIVVGVLLCWLLPWQMQLMFSYYKIPFFRVSLFCSITLAGIYIFVRIIINELIHTVYIITNNAIIRKSPSSTLSIPFTHISDFNYKPIPFFGFRKGVIIAGSVQLPLYFHITKLAQLSMTVRKNLQQNNTLNQKCIAQLLIFEKDAAISDFLFDEFGKKIIHLILLSTSLFLFNTFVASIYWNIHLYFSFAWVLFGTLFPIMGYFIAQRFISFSLKHLLKKQNNIFFTFDPNKIYSSVSIIMIIVYLLSGIMFKKLWFYIYF